MKSKNFKLEIGKDARPMRTAEWYEEEGLARIKAIKFEGKLGKWLCRVLKKQNYIVVNLDEMGSFIWKRCDGKTTVGEILNEMKESMGEKFEEEGMEKRSFLFLHMLKNRGLITWE
ncbi:MAG: PqqD family protein [Candidatus Thermoplasmatota archaeon]|nr:PqqD family protein [Candidatus Thermoplasmatota archaeon]